MKKIILSLMCLIMLTGCNLAYREATAAATGPIQTETDSSALLADSAVVLVLRSESLTGQSAEDCSPHSDWPVYIVVGGDTLSDIALRFNTTLDELTAANCLENPRLILVQQRLFVPQTSF